MKPTTQSHAANSYSVLWYCWVLLLVAAMLHFGSVNAEPVGKVVSLSDPSQLLAKKADGKIKVLNQNSVVETGDVLESQTNTYAKIKFNDNSEITLAPNTQFKIDQYSYNKDKPQEDRSVYTLIKGTLRSITGSLGKRSTERYQLNTPAATIGIRGTKYLARYIPKEDVSDASDTKDKKDKSKENKCDGHHSALTVEVIGGVIHLKNTAGEQTYTAGQYGCAASNQDAPEVLTSNPGLDFSPNFNKTLQCKV
jgi:hypothetical protein